MKKLAMTTALMALSGVTQITQAAESPEWNFVSLSYQSVDFDGDKLTGFGLSGSALVSDNVFLAGNYGQASDDIDFFGESVDLELTTVSLGIGYRHAISPTTDVYGAISYEDIEAKASFRGESGSESEDGYGLQSGLRSMVSEQIELGGAIGYVDINGESDTSVGVTARYYASDAMALGVGHTRADDVDATRVFVSLLF